MVVSAVDHAAESLVLARTCCMCLPDASAKVGDVLWALRSSG